MRLLLPVCLLALVAAATPAVPAGPYTYVVCADVCPFKTIQQAADLARPGDRILVRPGVYAEQVHWDKPGLTLRSFGGTAVIDATLAPGADPERATAIVACGGGAVVRGLTIRAGAHVGGGIGVLLCGDGNRVEGNVVDGAWVGVAALYSSSSGNVVVRNEIRGASGWAIAECCDLQGNVYERNHIHDNHHGILVDSAGAVVRHNRFEANGPVALACSQPVDARANYWGSPLGPAPGAAQALAGLDEPDVGGGACLDAEVVPWCLAADCADPLATLPLR